MAGPRVLRGYATPTLHSLSLLALAARRRCSLSSRRDAAAAPALPAAAPRHRRGHRRIPLDRVVAVVGDVIITQSNLQRAHHRQDSQEGAAVPTDSAGFKRLRRSQSLNELVDEELLLQKAKELKIEVPDADINNTVDKQFKDDPQPLRDRGRVQAELAKAGYGTPEEYKRFLTDGIKRNEMISRTTKKLREDGKIVAGQRHRRRGAGGVRAQQGGAAEARAERHLAPDHHRAQAVARREGASRASKAESLLAEIKRGADFEQLAKRESADSGSRVNGGDLGWTRRGKMVPEFDRWLFGYYALSPGQLSPVVETPFGYHIIRVDRVNAGEVKSRHILITPKIDSADVAARAARGRQRRRAVACRRVVRLAREEASRLSRAARRRRCSRRSRARSCRTQYQQAFADKKAKDIVVFDIPGNANIPAKVVVAQIASVEEGGDLTLAEVKERFRSRLAEEGGVRRLLDGAAQADVRLRSPEDAIDLTPLPDLADALIATLAR